MAGLWEARQQRQALWGSLSLLHAASAPGLAQQRSAGAAALGRQAVAAVSQALGQQQLAEAPGLEP